MHAYTVLVIPLTHQRETTTTPTLKRMNDAFYVISMNFGTLIGLSKL